MIKILILGTTGLLGWKVLETFKKNLDTKSYAIFGTSRSKSKNYVYFDFFKKNTFKNIEQIKPHYIINCIGLLSSKFDEEILGHRINCLKLNTFLPMRLANKFPQSKIIHISTNGVYDGLKGNYLENDTPNCNNLYGRSKLLGEIKSNNVMNIRTSLIGFEKKNNEIISLLNWFIKNKSKKLFGYTNHYWNGITNLSLSKLLLSIIENDLFIPKILNISSKDIISKYDLLVLFNKTFNNQKTIIIPKNSAIYSDLTLGTINSTYMIKLWKLSAYKTIPSSDLLINELKT